MQSRTLTLMVIALACGLGAAYLAWKYAGGGAEKNVAMKKVLVPKQDIRGLQRLNDPNMFTEMEVKESTLRDPNDVVISHDQIKDMRAKDFTLNKEKPFYLSDVVKYRDSNLGARLNPGEVAVSIPVDAQLAGSGLIEVGNRVDICTQIPSVSGDPKIVFKVVFQNIEVLGVNSDAAPSPDGTPKPPNSLTLRMPHDKVPALSGYRSRGQTFHVFLRKPGDNTIYDYKEFVLGESETHGDKENKPKEVAMTDTPKEPVTPPVTTTPTVPAVMTQPAPTVQQPTPTVTQPVPTKPLPEIDNEPKFITTRIVGDGSGVKMIKTEIKKEEKKKEVKSEVPSGSQL